MEVRAEHNEAEQRLRVLAGDRVHLEPLTRGLIVAAYAEYIQFSEEHGQAVMRDPASADMRRDAIYSAFLAMRAKCSRLIGPVDTDALFGTLEEVQASYDEHTTASAQIDAALSVGPCRWAVMSERAEGHEEV